MDLNEIMHFLKRAISFKTRDAGTVTWASERPAPRAPRRAPGIDGSGCFGGHASFGAPGPDARGSRGARAARSSLSGRFPFLPPSRLRCYRGVDLLVWRPRSLPSRPPGL